MQLNETGVYQYTASEWVEIPADAGFTEISIEHDDGEHEAPFQLSRSKFVRDILRRGQHEVFARSVDLGPQAKIRVKTVEVAYFHDQDYDSFETDRLTIGLKVTLSMPGTRYIASAEADDVLMKDLKSTEDESNGSYEWELDRALLPGAGLRIEWEPIVQQAP